jgi:DNA repair exonuclease SbcCD ATPase subunit
MTNPKSSLGDERIAEIRQRWEGFDWSCHGSALKGVRAVKDIHALLAALTTLQAEVEAREQAAADHPAVRHSLRAQLERIANEHPQPHDARWIRGASSALQILERRAETAEQALEAAEQKIKSLTARAIVAEQHKTLELLSKGSATEQLEMRLREKLAAAELRAEAAEQRITALEGALRAKVAEWRQYIAEEDNDEWGRERASTLSDAADELEALIGASPVPSVDFPQPG